MKPASDAYADWSLVQHRARAGIPPSTDLTFHDVDPETIQAILELVYDDEQDRFAYARGRFARDLVR